MSYCTVSETCQDGISPCNEDCVLSHNCLWYWKYAQASCALAEFRKAEYTALSVVVELTAGRIALAILGWGAVHCLWKRSLAKLNADNPRAIADSPWWFKTNIAGVKRRSARVLCIRGSGVPRGRRSTGLLKWDVRTLRTLRRCAS